MIGLLVLLVLLIIGRNFLIKDSKREIIRFSKEAEERHKQIEEDLNQYRKAQWNKKLNGK